MKTFKRCAEDIGGGDKILVDGVVKEVRDADYILPNELRVNINLVSGETIQRDSYALLEIVEE